MLQLPPSCRRRCVLSPLVAAAAGAAQPPRPMLQVGPCGVFVSAGHSCVTRHHPAHCPASTASKGSPAAPSQLSASSSEAASQPSAACCSSCCCRASSALRNSSCAPSASPCGREGWGTGVHAWEAALRGAAAGSNTCRHQRTSSSFSCARSASTAASLLSAVISPGAKRRRCLAFGTGNSRDKSASWPNTHAGVQRGSEKPGPCRRPTLPAAP